MVGRKQGTPKTGGRQKGVPNKVNPTAAQIMAQYGVSGIEGLCKIAAGEALRCTTHLNKETGEVVVEEIEPTFDQRQAAYKELAQYEAPKLKAIEHSGELNLTHENFINGATSPPESTD